MSQSQLGTKITVLALAILPFAAAAHAQATRTWVSGVGNDADPCSRTAPCKTFAGALSKTMAGGEISVLDPGGFGGVTINKALTISGDGTLAGILFASANGIIVNAGVNDKVILRNLSLAGAGTGINGIRYLAGKQLTVENVTISGCTTRGIDASLSSGGTLNLKNVSITGCPTGIRIATTTGFATATLEDVQLNSMTTGLEAAASGGGSFVSVRNSSINSNSTGILASGATSVVNATGNTISFNTTGVNASVSGATIRLADNQIYNNSTGVNFVAGAVVETGQNNMVDGNGSSLAPNSLITVQ